MAPSRALGGPRFGICVTAYADVPRRFTPARKSRWVMKSRMPSRVRKTAMGSNLPVPGHGGKVWNRRRPAATRAINECTLLPLSSHSRAPGRSARWGGKRAFLRVSMNTRRVPRRTSRLTELCCMRGGLTRRHPEQCSTPAASEAVMIGVLTQKEPCLSTNRWIVCASVDRALSG